jgi:hypothetical protein
LLSLRTTILAAILLSSLSGCAHKVTSATYCAAVGTAQGDGLQADSLALTSTLNGYARTHSLIARGQYPGARIYGDSSKSPSLIGVVEVKLLLLTFRFVPDMSRPRVTRFSSQSARGPLHDGVRRTRRLNLFHDLVGLQPTGSGLSTRSPGPSSPRERSGSPSRVSW